MLRREELAKMLRTWEDEYQSKNTNKEDKCEIVRIEMELELGKRIEDLEFVAEEDYQTNIM